MYHIVLAKSDVLPALLASNFYQDHQSTDVVKLSLQKISWQGHVLTLTLASLVLLAQVSSQIL